MAEARRLWAEEEEDEVVDDCTVVVALLDIPPAVKRINLSVAAGIDCPDIAVERTIKTQVLRRSISMPDPAAKLASLPMGCVPRF